MSAAAATVEIAETPVGHAEALALIAASEAELSGLYAPEHRNALSPEQLAAAGVRFVVACREGRPLACGGMAVCRDADGAYAELKRIFVAREARRSGLARAGGLRLVRLETGEASPEAIALYERLGYRRRPPFGAYRDNGSSVFMEKAL